MASRKKRPPDEEPESKRAPQANYGTILQMQGKKKELKEYDEYLKEHQRRLRRLEREARGEFVPGDYDGGY